MPFHEIGPYRVLKMLGEGGMGVVYLGKRDDLASVAAIKLLRDGWISPARRERFANEQRTLAQLTHPGITMPIPWLTAHRGLPWSTTMAFRSPTFAAATKAPSPIVCACSAQCVKRYAMRTHSPSSTAI